MRLSAKKITKGKSSNSKKKKTAEHKLHESYAFLQSIIHGVADPIMVIDKDYHLRMMNTAASVFSFGRKITKKITDNLLCCQVLHHRNTPCRGKHHSCPLKSVKKTRKPVKVVHEHLQKHGESRLFEILATPLYDHKKKFLGIIESKRDITDRRQYEDALSHEKERLNVTLRSIGDGVITTDPDGRIVFINKAAEILTGWKQKQAIGKHIQKVFHVLHEDTRLTCPNPVEKVLRKNEIVTIFDQALLVAKNKSEHLISDSGAPIYDKNKKLVGVVIVFSDVTEKKKMQDELLKATKLESLGVLAGGIAHDFNNILTAINTNVSLARLDTNLTHETIEYLTDVEQEVHQAKGLTKQLLTFSREEKPLKALVSISDIISNSLSLGLRGSNVTSELLTNARIWPVEADRTQIGQVFNNLILNAVQAMPKGGTIHIKLENTHLKKRAHGLSRDEKPGKYVRISIKDEGCGIPKSYINKIFDPFFTTKKDGNGLGLSITYSIIKKHNGFVSLDCLSGKGTCFIIHLPASIKKRVSSITKKEKEISYGKGKILLMDDESIIRKGTSRILSHLGYQVKAVSNGVEALSVFQKARKEGSPFDAVILDLTIPGGMGGKETIKKLLKIDPDIRCIMTSGYHNEAMVSCYQDYGFRAFIFKPYNIQEISQILNDVLTGKLD